MGKGEKTEDEADATITTTSNAMTILPFMHKIERLLQRPSALQITIGSGCKNNDNDDDEDDDHDHGNQKKENASTCRKRDFTCAQARALQAHWGALLAGHHFTQSESGALTMQTMMNVILSLTDQIRSFVQSSAMTTPPPQSDEIVSRPLAFLSSSSALASALDVHLTHIGILSDFIPHVGTRLYYAHLWDDVLRHCDDLGLVMTSKSLSLSCTNTTNQEDDRLAIMASCMLGHNTLLRYTHAGLTLILEGAMCAASQVQYKAYRTMLVYNITMLRDDILRELEHHHDNNDTSDDNDGTTRRSTLRAGRWLFTLRLRHQIARFKAMRKRARTLKRQIRAKYLAYRAFRLVCSSPSFS